MMISAAWVATRFPSLSLSRSAFFLQNDSILAACSPNSMRRLLKPKSGLLGVFHKFNRKAKPVDGPEETAGPATAKPETTELEDEASESDVELVGPEAAFKSSPDPRTDPWALAYEIFEQREPQLMADYKAHLESLLDAPSSEAPSSEAPPPETPLPETLFLPTTAASSALPTPQSVESIISRLLEDRGKKQWRVSRLGKNIKIREQAEKLAKFGIWTGPAIKDTQSAQPYAALAWSGVSMLLPLLTGRSTPNEAMLKGFNSVSDIQVYWRICEDTYLRTPYPYQTLVDHLAKLYSHVVEYQARVICHLSQAQLSRVWQNVTGWNDWIGMASNIDKLSKQCSSYMPHLVIQEKRAQWNSQLQEIQGSRAILDEIREVLREDRNQAQQNYEDQKERDLLHNLASTFVGGEGSLDYGAGSGLEAYKDFNPPRERGTCEWFFKNDSFLKWRDSSTSSLLWFSAGPGCGKSVLSRALIDERLLSTKVTTSTVCYFFFKDGDKRRMHSTNALSAILHQLFTQDSTGTLIQHALPGHKNYGPSLTRVFSELWRILVGCASSSTAGEIVCILDALDECKKESRLEIIRALRAFYAQAGQLSRGTVKFLVTSRPEDYLQRDFEAFSAFATYLHLDRDEKSDDIKHDIDCVIDARARGLPAGFSDQVRHGISKSLKSMENRTYLWLALMFELITENLGQYSRECDIENLPSLLPSGVSKAYEKILDRGRDSARTRALLRIVLAATRPLTLDEANYALALASSEIGFNSHVELERHLFCNFELVAKNLCGLFLTVHDSTVSFIHPTARAFLTAPPEPGMKWKGCFSMPRSHSTILRCCLDYLLLPDLPENFRVGYDEQKYPLAIYAARSWPFHQEAIDNQSRKHACTLFDTAKHPVEVWLPIYLSARWDRRYLEDPSLSDMTLATFLGLKPVVEDILLEPNTDVNALDRRNRTPLVAALDGSQEGHRRIKMGSHADIIKMLLDKSAKVNIRSGFLWNPLHIVAGAHYTETVQSLLHRGADVNTRCTYPGETVLEEAAKSGHKDGVVMLLKIGTDHIVRHNAFEVCKGM